MWARFVDLLRCPRCKGAVSLETFKRTAVRLDPEFEDLARRRAILAERFAEQVAEGLLLCAACKTMFPILDGLPIMLSYTTALHDQFVLSCGSRALEPYAAYEFPNGELPSGEQEVMKSFSKEWLDYDYDGVIWEMSYEDHERRFLTEIGPALNRLPSPTFLEVGCGLGITTHLAHKNSGGDTVGLDLSLAVYKASKHYQANPFLHFVQASVFGMPFAPRSFDLIYSRGVLHHTASTEAAFGSVAPLCRRGGSVYLWVYGRGSIHETPFRRALYGLERAFRPALSAAPDSPAAKAFLTAMGIGYVAFNGARRLFNRHIKPLNLKRGVHAARDRFTPRFAHRHEANEVLRWFRLAGFEEAELVDWKAMPTADHDDFRRNIGVRGKLTTDSLAAR